MELSHSTESVDVRSSKMLHAIASMCPRLIAVQFRQHSTTRDFQMPTPLNFLTNKFTEVFDSLKKLKNVGK